MTVTYNSFNWNGWRKFYSAKYFGSPVIEMVKIICPTLYIHNWNKQDLTNPAKTDPGKLFNSEFDHSFCFMLGGSCRYNLLDWFILKFWNLQLYQLVTFQSVHVQFNPPQLTLTRWVIRINGRNWIKPRKVLGFVQTFAHY